MGAIIQQDLQDLTLFTELLKKRKSGDRLKQVLIHMHRKSWLIAAVVLVVASAPLVTSWIPLSPLTSTPDVVYPGNHAFLHLTGMHSAAGWDAYYRIHSPGYLVSGLKSGGESFPQGNYRYDFYFALQPGHLISLLSSANDVVSLEAFDASAHEVLSERTFQMADFKRVRKGLVRKTLTFSTWGRSGHFFEPRIFWQGLSGVTLARIERIALPEEPAGALREKAEAFEQMMPGVFLDHGYVITRDANGKVTAKGDAAIWTGLYAAAEAWRYKTSQSPQAQIRLEESLWAMHSLCKSAPLPGTLVRYIEPDGTILAEAPSKDTYTGFFYAAAQGLPYVKNPALRRALITDLDHLAGHFLDHDLAFVSPYGSPVDMNPYPSHIFISEAIEELRENASLRRDLIRMLQLARWYFWIHGQKAPSAFGRFIACLKAPQAARFEAELVPLINDLRAALRQVQQNVHRSALRGPRQGLTDTPYIHLDLLLLRALHNLDEETDGQPFASIEELKVLPSQALHALHFLKVAGEMLPKPNRYDTYYRANLYEGKALLRTAMQWHQIDEDALGVVLGETEADTRRNASSHLSYLALHDLILLEKDPLVRFKYQKLFEAQYRPMRLDGNAMIDAMQTAVGLSTKQLGLAWYALGRYPQDRRGKGDLYWKENRKELLEAFGGELNRQARDPLPPDMRPRDAFLWQRSAHSISGDEKDWLYPPLDYLFAYWLATNSANLEAVTEKS